MRNLSHFPTAHYSQSEIHSAERIHSTIYLPTGRSLLPFVWAVCTPLLCVALPCVGVVGVGSGWASATSTQGQGAKPQSGSRLGGQDPGSAAGVPPTTCTVSQLRPTLLHTPHSTRRRGGSTDLRQHWKPTRCCHDVYGAAVVGLAASQLLQGRGSKRGLQDPHDKRQPPPPPPPPRWVGGRVSGEPKPHRVWRRSLQAAAAAAAADTRVCQQQQQQQHRPAHGVQLAAILLNTDHLSLVYPMRCSLFFEIILVYGWRHMWEIKSAQRRKSGIQNFKASERWDTAQIMAEIGS